ncbi:MAG: fibronectin type III domain-containing protein, partial [Acutalibacteraceae bacterium]
DVEYTDTYTVVIPATGHEYSAPVWTWTADLENGSATATFTCFKCDDVQTPEVTVTSEVTLDATCLTDGTLTYTATATFEDEEYTDTYDVVIPALGHDFSEEIHDEAHLVERANCVHLDLYRYSCIRCDVMGEETYEFGGELQEHVKVQRIEEKYLVSKADCTHSAVYKMGCQNCETIFDETYEDGTPLYHKFTKEVVKQTATTKREGYINFHCADCGVSDDQPIPIAKLASAKLSATSFIYTGKAVTPGIVVKDVDGVVLEKGIDYTVSYQDNTEPGTGKLILTFIGKYSGKYTFNFTINIGKPEKVAFSANTSTIKIAWSQVAGAAGYGVYYKTASGWKKLGNTTKLEATFSKLPAGTKYTFAIRAAIKKDGKVIWSNIYSTLEASTAPLAPAKVTSAQSTSAIKLSWSAVKGATAYRVYYNTSKGWKKLGDTAATSCTFKKLPSGTSYMFAVRPYIKTANGAVWGDYKTLITATKPATPTAKAVSNSSKTITVSWNKVQGASGYQVFYKTATGNYTLIKTVGPNVTVLTDTDYTSGSTYTIAVRAYKAVSGGYIYGSFNPVKVTVR